MTDPSRIDDIVAQVAHALRQADKDARNWEAQSKDWERVAQRQRAEIEQLTRALNEATMQAEYWKNEVSEMRDLEARRIALEASEA